MNDLSPIGPAPLLKTALPGPLAKALIAQDEQFTSPSYTRFYPLAVKRGRGAVIEDLDGNLFLDFTAGIAVCSTGHCHPKIVSAIAKQAGELVHMSGTDFYYEPQAQLAKKLAEIAPGPAKKRVFFTNSGTEAIEAAIKLARYHTRRPQIIAFRGAFHGRTLGSLSLTASKVTQRAGFQPLLTGVQHSHFANCFRCPIHLAYPACGVACAKEIEESLFKQLVAPNEVAAIVVEAIQGEGGYLVPPPEFHPILKSICEKHGILYVVDEVQSGMGRTGKMFAIEHFGVAPDIVCTAKGIASGLPLGAMIAREEIMTWKPGSHASTFGGNPIACAAALETISLLETSLMANATKQGNRLLAGLKMMATKHPAIGDVRGIGLMSAIDLVKSRETREPDAALREAVVLAAFHKGLLLLGCGPSAIRFCAPLVIDETQVDTCVRILDEVLSEARAK